MKFTQAISSAASTAKQATKKAWHGLTGAGGQAVVTPSPQRPPSDLSFRFSYNTDTSCQVERIGGPNVWGNREGDTDTESVHTAPTTAPPTSLPALVAPTPSQPAPMPPAPPVAPAPTPSQLPALPVGLQVAPAPSIPATVLQPALPVALPLPTATLSSPAATVLVAPPHSLPAVAPSATRPVTQLLLPDLVHDFASIDKWLNREGESSSDVEYTTPSTSGSSAATPAVGTRSQTDIEQTGALTAAIPTASFAHVAALDVRPPLDAHMGEIEAVEPGASLLAFVAPGSPLPVSSSVMNSADAAPTVCSAIEDVAEPSHSPAFDEAHALDVPIACVDGPVTVSSPALPVSRAASPALTARAPALPSLAAEDVEQVGDAEDIVMIDSSDGVDDIRSPSPCQSSFDVIAQMDAGVAAPYVPAESPVVALPASPVNVTLDVGDSVLLGVAHIGSPDEDTPNDPLRVDEGADRTTKLALSASRSMSPAAPAISPTSADEARGAYVTDSAPEAEVLATVRGISDDADSDTFDGSPQTDDASVTTEAPATTGVSWEMHTDPSAIDVAVDTVDVTLGVDVEVDNAVVLNATDEVDRISAGHEVLEGLDDRAITNTGSVDEVGSDARQDDVAMVDATNGIYDDDDDFLPHASLDSPSVHANALGDEMQDPSTPTLSLPVTPFASPSTASSQGPVTPVVQVAGAGGLLPVDDSLSLVSRAARKRSPTPDSDEDQTPAAKRHRRLIKALGLPERLDQPSSDGLGSPVSRPSFLRRALKGRADGRPSALDRALRRRHRGRSRGSSTSGDESATEHDGDEEELDAIMEDAAPESTLASDYHAILQDAAPSSQRTSEYPPPDAPGSPAPSLSATSPPASDAGFRLDHDTAVSADDVVKTYLNCILPAYDGEIEVGKNDIQLEILLRDADDAPFHEHLKILCPDLQDTAATTAHTGANLARAARGIKTLELCAPFTSSLQHVVHLDGLEELHFDEDNGAMGDSLRFVSAPEIQVVIGKASNWPTFNLFVDNAQLTHVAVLSNAENKITVAYEDSDYRVRGFCNVASNLFSRFMHLPAVINADVFTIGDALPTRDLSALRNVGNFNAKALRINVSNPDTIRTLVAWGRELVRFPNVILVVFCGSTRFGPWKASQPMEAPAITLREMGYILDVVLPCPRGPEIKFATPCYHA